MNLPNTITATRIAVSPLIALLPFSASSRLRFIGFAVFLAAAISDHFDGWLARTRNLVTDLGRILDPLADKLLLVCTMVPMFILMAPKGDWLSPPVGMFPDGGAFPFALPFGKVGFPGWVLVLVLGREVFMTVFRQIAAARGLVIEAIGSAKWKTACQLTWAGAAYFWFGASTAAMRDGWSGTLWHSWALFNCSVGVAAMGGAILLSIYSLSLYLSRYGQLLLRTPRSRTLGPRP